jgi:hypothetical protein
MACQDLHQREQEDPTLIIQDLIRNGLLSVHKTLMDAQTAIEQAEHKINVMMQGLQTLVDLARAQDYGTKTDRDKGQD